MVQPSSVKLIPSPPQQVGSSQIMERNQNYSLHLRDENSEGITPLKRPGIGGGNQVDPLLIGIIIFCTLLSLAIIIFILYRFKSWQCSSMWSKLCCRREKIEPEPSRLQFHLPHEVQVLGRVSSVPEITNGIKAIDSEKIDSKPPSYELVADSQILPVQSQLEKSNNLRREAPPPQYIQVEIQRPTHL